MKTANWVSKNRSSDPSPQNKTRYNEFVEVVFGARAPFGIPSPLTPSQKQPPGERAHQARRPAASKAKKTFEFQDRISPPLQVDPLGLIMPHFFVMG